MKKEVSALKIMKNHEHSELVRNFCCRVIEFEKPGGGIATHKCSHVKAPFEVIQCSIARQS